MPWNLSGRNLLLIWCLDPQALEACSLHACCFWRWIGGCCVVPRDDGFYGDVGLYRGYTSYSLNSLKGDYIGDCYKGHEGGYWEFRLSFI